MSTGQEHGRERGPEQRTADTRATPRTRARLGPLPRPLALALLGVWAVASLFALVQLFVGSSPWSGATEGMIPSEHRSPSGRPLALLRVDLQALEQAASPGEQTDPVTDALTDPATILAEAGFAIEEALGQRRVPLAPPRTEITRWLDAHALYLLPIETHAALAERLSDASMLAEVRGLEARLSSPLFVVSGEQPRRDPLGIHELTTLEAGQLGHVTEVLGTDAPKVSASGDLIAASGDRALIALVTDPTKPQAEQITELRTKLEAALEGLPVELALFDPSLRETTLEHQLSRDWTKLLAGCFAGLILLLAIALRRVIPVLALGVCLASAWVMLVWAAVNLELNLGIGLGMGLDGMELASIALSILLLGFGCDAALRLQEIDSRGWVSTLIMAGALVPLALSPYPLWQRWALWWPLAYLVLAVILRVILPALLELLRGDFDWRRPGFRLAPMPALAVLICLSVSAAGAWVTPQLRYRSPARVPVLDPELQANERELIQHFFDPSMIVETTSQAPSEANDHETPAAAALEASAATATQLAALVPNEARRLDSPGSFVLPRAELEARKQALSKLNLSQRMEALEVVLTDQRLRAEAFAEFVRGAADIHDLPSAQAALDGPLGPWINGYFVSEGGNGDERVALRSRLELRGHDGLAQVPLSDQRLAELPPLRGPAIAAMIDQREYLRRAGVVLLAGLWLTAFLVWLGTGGLGIALACALVSLACEAGVMLGLSLLDQPTGPHLLPVILIVGATAGVAGGRACRAVSLGQPIVARGLLLAGGCQIIAGGVLLISAQPLWRELGLAVAIGSALACGLGLFATPGLASLFGKFRGPRSPKNKPSQAPTQAPTQDPGEPKP
ncbi:membrane protein, exporter [Enhygromyxa salina]|uniref:Membrane protein, exporter n=1 Tax=Enhygromyxa salina TaxID=215803 RepID=A0A0C2CQN9_9BACT|nr:hypothetical protein [Enhygromyxa salina]KIG13496.1 membrane protein, exporter [Enhygromyxa salina]